MRRELFLCCIELLVGFHSASKRSVTGYSLDCNEYPDAEEWFLRCRMLVFLSKNKVFFWRLHCVSCIDMLKSQSRIL